MSEKVFDKKGAISDTLLAMGIFCLCAISLLLIRRGMPWEYFISLISRAVVLSIITMGAVFVFTIGAFGISLGASTLMGVSFGALVYEGTDNIFLGLLACVGAPVCGCVISSALSSLFSLPPYVTAALMLGLFGSVARLILQLRGGEIVTGLGGGIWLNSPWARLLCFGLFFGFCILLYHIFPVGKRQKELGDNRDRARLLGLSRSILSLIGFFVAGLGVGIGSFLILCSFPSVDRGSVSDLGFNIIFAIILGGMSLSGGSRSHLSSAIWGSFSAIFLSEIIYAACADSPLFSGLSQIIRGGILLILMAILNYRERNIKNRR